MAERPVLPPAPGESQTGSALQAGRPDLVVRYRSALPAARAAILGRLWGALGREPIAGVSARSSAAGTLTLTLADGRRVVGDAAAAEPFAEPPAGWSVTVDGRPYQRPDRLVAALRLPGADRLSRELGNSVANLALGRAGSARGGSARDAPGPAGPGDLADAEQAVVDGHPLHPCCRTRIGFSTADVLAYAPEHRPVVRLVAVAVPAKHWLSTGTGMPPILPVHPAQLPRVLDTGLVQETGATMRARPLMSLRTVALLDEPTLHLKTALDVQMTSAVRIVSAAAVRNGPTVSALLVGLTRHTPGLTVLRELAGGAVLLDGEPSASMAAVWREAPRLGPGERVLPLAALTAAAPDGRPIVAGVIDEGYAGRPTRFFGDLVAMLLPPLLKLLHLGVALEAHGQNTLLVLRAGRPARILYRDVGGIRISPHRLGSAGIEAPALHGSLTEDDPAALSTRLFAAVVSTVLAELVAVLARAYGAPPPVLWGQVAAVARAAYAALPVQAGVDRAALFGPVLPVKAMTAMRLADDPLTDRWAALPNPIAGLS
ncbi:MAG TPA: IucA/IucC family protein [Micromonosporaceae bacterium]|nr:IucA/IucC family protein [Micromonosporaceae bacterium]